MPNYALMNPGNYRLPNSFRSPPFQGIKYEEDFVPFKTIRWKTACINERRVYVGNVEIVTNDEVTKLLPDTIFKSDLGKFDRFTERGRIDVATGDGEDIIVLQTFADRILEFKDKTLHIINVAGGKEFLEESLKYKGLLNSQAVCNTDLGVAWANKNGVFLYDGRSIKNLVEEGAKRKILPKTWSDFITTETQVAYFPIKRQLIVIKQSKSLYPSASPDDGNMYLYDFPTKSWTQHDSRFLFGSNTNNRYQTNIVNYPYSNKEEAVFGQQVGADIKVTHWQDTASLGTIDIQTKDLDFGQPGVQKLISKIYITSKKAEGIYLTASSNGGQSFLGNYNNSSSYGSELISNGTFDSATTGWEAVRATLTVESQKLRVANDGGTGNAIAFEEFAAIPGRTYRVTANFIAGTDEGAKIAVGKTDALDTGIYQGGVDKMTTNTSVDFTFVAADTTQVVWLYAAQTDADGEYHEWDNVSIKEKQSSESIGLSTGALNTGSSWGVTQHNVVGINPSTYSIQLRLNGTAATGMEDFAINDISVIYRMKGAR